MFFDLVLKLGTLDLWHHLLHEWSLSEFLHALLPFNNVNFLLQMFINSSSDSEVFRVSFKDFLVRCHVRSMVVFWGALWWQGWYWRWEWVLIDWVLNLGQCDQRRFFYCIFLLVCLIVSSCLSGLSSPFWVAWWRLWIWLIGSSHADHESLHWFFFGWINTWHLFWLVRVNACGYFSRRLRI